MEKQREGDHSTMETVIRLLYVSQAQDPIVRPQEKRKDGRVCIVHGNNAAIEEDAQEY